MPDRFSKGVEADGRDWFSDAGKDGAENGQIGAFAFGSLELGDGVAGDAD